MATIIPAHTGVTSWSHPSGIEGHFRPNGRLELVTFQNGDVRHNGSTWKTTGAKTLAARIFVGFNVGGRLTWKMDDLVDVVRRARVKQGQRPDASFIAQKGIYTHTAPGKKSKIIEENGAQVILIRMLDEPERSFRKHMIKLAEQIATELQQAEVVLELQRGGVVEEVMGVEP